MTTKTNKFYTDREVELIRTFISNNKPVKDNVEVLAKRMKRSVISVANKYAAVKRSMKSGTSVKSPRKGANVVDIPKGLRLEFKATKIILEDGKITLFY